MFNFAISDVSASWNEILLKRGYNVIHESNRYITKLLPDPNGSQLKILVRKNSDE